MIRRSALPCALAATALPAATSEQALLAPLIAQHVKAHGVPEALVHRVIQRESGYNPRASNRGNLGLMQIRHATARGMGHTGPASGLLDANTNLTYGVAYLGNAYKVAGGNANRTLALYASGYYYEAKRKGLLPQLRTGVPISAPGPSAPTPMTGGASVSSWLTKVFTPAESSLPQQASGYAGQ
jgi:soluble lytic murein transglycosylase-like protein